MDLIYDKRTEGSCRRRHGTRPAISSILRRRGDYRVYCCCVICCREADISFYRFPAPLSLVGLGCRGTTDRPAGTRSLPFPASRRCLAEPWVDPVAALLQPETGKPENWDLPSLLPKASPEEVPEAVPLTATKRWDEPLKEPIAKKRWDEPRKEPIAKKRWDEPMKEPIAKKRWDEPKK